MSIARIIGARTIGASAAAMALATTAVAQGPTPQPHGAVAYLAYDADGFAQTFVACPDLANPRPIAASPGRNTGYATWSPDGTRLAFDTDRDDPDLGAEPPISDVYTIATDGSELRKLTRSDGFDGAPAWSPDGRTIAFQRSDAPGEAPGIFLMDATDGTGRTRLSSAPDGSVDWSPWFSPDGTSVVFTRIFNPLEPDDAKALSAMYVVDADGGDPVRLTPESVNPGDGVWSPDGTTIVFEVFGDGGRGDTWAIHPDGTGLRSLTAAVAGISWSRDPTWSPDGSHVLVPTSAGLLSIASDGTEWSIVATVGDPYHQPDWSAGADCAGPGASPQPRSEVAP